MLRDRKWTAVALGLGLMIFVTGCSSMSPVQGVRLDANKKEIGLLIRRYADSVREDDVEAVMDLVDPQLSKERRETIRERIRLATWMSLYTGYQADTELTLEECEVELLQPANHAIELVGTNAEDETLRDQIVVRRTEEGWMFRDIHPVHPEEGAPLDMPEGEVAELQSLVAKLMKALDDGNTGRIMAILPDDEAVYTRKTDPGLLGKIFNRGGEEYSVIDDLERIYEFDFHEWPDEDDLPQFFYVGPRTIRGIYKVSYAYAAQGIQEDTLRIEMWLGKQKDGWEAQLLRVSGRGIPGS
ncbi:MAG: hypothetical protein ACOC2T_02485 [Planctomycetota bacterium]